MAIDEISIRKGPVSMTFVLNLDGGAVVFVRDGKEADALNPFWKRPKASHTRVEAVAMDLSAACRLAVTTHLAEAAIVYDLFHIVKLLNDKLTALRRDLYRNATDKEQRRVAGNPLADYQAVGEPGRLQGRVRASGRGVVTEYTAGSGVLPRGRTGVGLRGTYENASLPLPERLDRGLGRQV